MPGESTGAPSLGCDVVSSVTVDCRIHWLLATTNCYHKHLLMWRPAALRWTRRLLRPGGHAATAATSARLGGEQQRLFASAHPEATVYPGPQSPRKTVTLRTLRSKYDKGQPITMVTAYDYPSAVHVSERVTTDFLPLIPAREV